MAVATEDVSGEKDANYDKENMNDGKKAVRKARRWWAGGRRLSDLRNYTHCCHLRIWLCW